MTLFCVSDPFYNFLGLLLYCKKKNIIKILRTKYSKDANWVILFRWKLEPSQAVVQVKEGNTALPVGVLAVKGYEVSGSITSFGSPISGIYVLLYSIEVGSNNYYFI